MGRGVGRWPGFLCLGLWGSELRATQLPFRFHSVPADLHSPVRPEVSKDRAEPPPVQAEVSKPFTTPPFGLSLSKPCVDSNTGFFDKFRCRSVAAAGDLLFFVSPKKPKEKKGDPAVCVPPLRCGQPAVLGPAGVELELAALRQSLALFRLDLRSSAHTEGVGREFEFGEALSPLRGLNAATFFIAACACIYWAIGLNAR